MFRRTFNKLQCLLNTEDIYKHVVDVLCSYAPLVRVDSNNRQPVFQLGQSPPLATVRFISTASMAKLQSWTPRRSSAEADVDHVTLVILTIALQLAVNQCGFKGCQSDHADLSCVGLPNTLGYTVHGVFKPKKILQS